jgi:hypothetical protein
VLDRVLASPGAAADPGTSVSTWPAALRRVAVVAAGLVALFCVALCLGLVAPLGAP